MNVSIVVLVVFVFSTQNMCRSLIDSLNPKTAALKAFKEKTSPELYDKTLRPNLTGGPVQINISMYIIDYAFDPIKREMRANMYYRQLWNDPRLVSQNIAVNIIGGQTLVDRVWIPDTFFANSLDVLDNKYPAYNSLLRVEPNGNILYSLKIQVLFRCTARVSIKTDECNLQIESYGYTMDDIVYGWSKSGVKLGKNVDNNSKYKVVEQMINLSSGLPIIYLPI